MVMPPFELNPPLRSIWWRWTLTMVASTVAYSMSGSSDTASNSRFQISKLRSCGRYGDSAAGAAAEKACLWSPRAGTILIGRERRHCSGREREAASGLLGCDARPKD